MPGVGRALTQRAGARRWDAAVIAVTLLLIAVTVLFLPISGKPVGAQGFAVITYGDNRTVLPLAADTEIELENKGLHVCIEVKDARVRFTYSDCPDRLCVNAGWLSRNGQTSACLPAGVVVRVSDPDNRQPDVIIS